MRGTIIGDLNSVSTGFLEGQKGEYGAGGVLLENGIDLAIKCSGDGCSVISALTLGIFKNQGKYFGVKYHG
mgnify:CR=1 FL=1